MAVNATTTNTGLLNTVINVFKTSPLAAIVLVGIGLIIGIIIDRALQMTMM